MQAAQETGPGTQTVDAPVGFWARLAYLLGPVAAGVAIWAILHVFVSKDIAADAWKAGSVSLFGAGTTVVFGKVVLGEKLTMGTWELAFLVIAVNAASGFWYAYNLDLLQKVPRVGPYLQRARRNAVRTLRQRRWIRRLSVVGVGLFVVTPLPGSGSLGGCLMGRIIGISKFASFMSVTVAGVIVCFAYAAAARQIEPLVVHAPLWAKIAGAVVVLVLIGLMVKLVLRLAGENGTADDDEDEEEAHELEDAAAPW